MSEFVVLVSCFLLSAGFLVSFLRKKIILFLDKKISEIDLQFEEIEMKKLEIINLLEELRGKKKTLELNKNFIIEEKIADIEEKRNLILKDIDDSFNKKIKSFQKEMDFSVSSKLDDFQKKTTEDFIKVLKDYKDEKNENSENYISIESTKDGIERVFINKK